MAIQVATNIRQRMIILSRCIRIPYAFLFNGLFFGLFVILMLILTLLDSAHPKVRDKLPHPLRFLLTREH